MSFLADWKNDEELESESGIPLYFGGDVEIQIRRAGGTNALYKKVLLAKLRPFERQSKAGTLSEEMSDQIMAQAYAEAVIIGWKNVTDLDGKKIAFNQKNVVQLLLDYPDLFAEIRAQANNALNFRREELEETAKN